MPEFQLPSEFPSSNKPNFQLPNSEIVKNKATITLTSFGLSQVKKAFYKVGETQEKDTPVKYSYLGTPIFTNVKLYTLDDTSFSNPFELDTVLVEVSQTKNIVTTAVAGRNGTVKEYISDGDYQISLKGLLVSQNPDVYPRQEVQQLIQLMQLQEALVVTCDFLQMFSIHNIVTTDYSFPQKEGLSNLQAFEISALSDDPYELSINK